MPIIDGAIILLRLAIIAIIGSASRSSRRRRTVRRLAERGGQLGEQRPVRLERALRPCARRDRHDLGDGAVEAGEVADVHLGDLGELAELDAHARVDVGLGCSTGGRQRGELARRVPVERSLAGKRPGEIAEHRQVLERVVGPWSVCHNASLRPVSALASVAMTVASTTTTVWVSDGSRRSWSACPAPASTAAARSRRER